jgi:hypothetical protein
MMLPILISVSVAPVSYFFCAIAPLEDAMPIASAVEAMANLLSKTGIPVSLCFFDGRVMRVLALLDERLATRPD